MSKEDFMALMKRLATDNPYPSEYGAIVNTFNRAKKLKGQRGNDERESTPSSRPPVPDTNLVVFPSLSAWKVIIN